MAKDKSELVVRNQMFYLLLFIGAIFYGLGVGLEHYLLPAGTRWHFVGAVLQRGGIAIVAIFVTFAFSNWIGSFFTFHIDTAWMGRCVVASAFICVSDVFAIAVTGYGHPWMNPLLAIGAFGIALGLIVAPFLKGAIDDPPMSVEEQQ
ncbi:MAG TPA: hypothetical protein VJA27_02305, partial [Patescibacteria group bacterium]|nr:hypothetical protein [Patescibacteria group bacterium]